MRDAESRENAPGGCVSDTLGLAAELLYTRWKRAVDILWRESVRRRRAATRIERERARSARRLKNLQRIVRHALSEYHRIELERQRRAEKDLGVGRGNLSGGPCGPPNPLARRG